MFGKIILFSSIIILTTGCSFPLKEQITPVNNSGFYIIEKDANIYLKTNDSMVLISDKSHLGSYHYNSTNSFLALLAFNFSGERTIYIVDIKTANVINKFDLNSQNNYIEYPYQAKIALSNSSEYLAILGGVEQGLVAPELPLDSSGCKQYIPVLFLYNLRTNKITDSRCIYWFNQGVVQFATISIQIAFTNKDKKISILGGYAVDNLWTHLGMMYWFDAYGVLFNLKTANLDKTQIYLGLPASVIDKDIDWILTSERGLSLLEKSGELKGSAGEFKKL